MTKNVAAGGVGTMFERDFVNDLFERSQRIIARI